MACAIGFNDWKFLGLMCISAFVIYQECKIGYEISAPYLSFEKPLRGITRGVPYLSFGTFDGSDRQYRNFHGNLTLLVAYFIFLVFSKKIWERVTGIPRLQATLQKPVDGGNNYVSLAQGEHSAEELRTRHRISRLYCIFYGVHGILFSIALHEATAFYFFISIYLFYLISLLNGSRANPTLTWVAGITILFACDYFQGYHMWRWLFGKEHIIARIMDGMRGPLAWHVYYRMSLLRVISYNCDKYWQYNNTAVFKTEDPYTKRVVQHLPREYFGFWEFTAYTLFPPLFIAGPIITFNCFMSQLIYPIRSNTTTIKWKQAGWTLLCIVLLDVMLHYNCLNALSLSFTWKEWDDPFSVAFVGMGTLHFMYLKFFCLWRFFRSASLFTDIVPPENMTRCVKNNHTFAGFWKSWHASFNKWTVRYMYVPMGGPKTQHFTIWLIFIFIGLWHDLWWSWVAWALMNCVFFTVEIIVTYFFYKPRWDWVRQIPGWPLLHCLLNGWNAAFIVCSNLCILFGFRHMPMFLYKSFWAPGAWSVYLAVSIIFGLAAHFQNEWREREDIAKAASQNNKLS